MERRRLITCTYRSSCETCSLFNFTDPFFKTVVDLDDRCTKEYEYPAYRPITEVYINGNLEDEFNQTRCCEGSRTLVYTIETKRNKEATTGTLKTFHFNTEAEKTSFSFITRGEELSSLDISTSKVLVNEKSTNVINFLNPFIISLAFNILLLAILLVLIGVTLRRRFQKGDLNYASVSFDRQEPNTTYSQLQVFGGDTGNSEYEGYLEPKSIQIGAASSIASSKSAENENNTERHLSDDKNMYIDPDVDLE